MHTLVLKPEKSALRYSLVDSQSHEVAHSGSIDAYRNFPVRQSVEDTYADCSAQDKIIDALVLHMSYGGELFTEPAVELDDRNLESLAELSEQSPLQIPVGREIAEQAQHCYPDIPIVAVFETAFFTHMPARERHYALPPLPDDQSGMGLRYGCHGICHQTAADLYADDNIISVCLDPKPEVTGIRFGLPVFTTGGNTPLQGLPSETASGDIDPYIVAMLSKTIGWGPEKINTVLSEESGIYGLTGTRMTLNEVFERKAEYPLTANLINYRILLACGAAIAAMGDIDRIVFSGKYKDIGIKISDYLWGKLIETHMTKRFTTEFIKEPTEVLAAKYAYACIA